jgi:hypothetical protein
MQPAQIHRHIVLTNSTVEDVPSEADRHSDDQEISCCYGTRRFITRVRESSYWTLS